MSDTVRMALDLSVNLARQAGVMLIERLGKGVEMELKGKIDPVTELDRQVEDFLVSRILEQFPDHAILAEEDTRTPGKSDYRWVIDPLDGTTNYAHGYPCFTVSIALESGGEAVMGVIYQPALDEMFTATRGGGTLLNGHPVTVSPQAELGKAFLVTGWPYNIQEPDVLRRNMERLEKFLGRSFAVRRDGSAAYNLACIAAGRFDGMWEEGLKCWDTSAGVLMVLEAGGVVSDFNGTAYRGKQNQPILVAGTKELHTRMLALLGSGAGKGG